MLDEAGTVPSKPDIRGQLTDAVIGFLTPYFASGIAIAVTMDEITLSQTVWAFVLPILLLLFPLSTIPYNPPGIAVVILIAGAFYAIPSLLPAGYSRYAFGFVFATWGIYGLYCTQWIAM